jgi:molybdopterin-containing oxidoreductase family iron-sulfur binding subunit
MSSKPDATKPWMDLDPTLVESGPERREPVESPPLNLRRRSFLSALGISGAVSMLGCERLPVNEALPLLETDEDSRPGSFVRYASTCAGCSAGCGMLVTTRDGRPVKLEGLEQHPLSRGGLCALGQGNLRALYDAGRLRKPQVGGSDSRWDAVDAAVTKGLAAAGGKLLVFSSSVVSPSMRGAIAALLSKHGGKHLEYDAGLDAGSGVLEAYRLLDGRPRQATYTMGRAELLLSFGADLLGSATEVVGLTRQYADRRREGKNGAAFRHVQVEGSLSLTGAAADTRLQATASERTLMLAHLLRAVAGKAGGAADLARAVTAQLPELPTQQKAVQQLAGELRAAGNKALVVSGSRNPTEQVAVALLNRLLGAEGNTVALQAPRTQRGSDAAASQLLGDVQGGKVAALVVIEANPVEQLPGGEALAKAIASLPLSVAITTRPNATAAACKVVAAAHHDLERWGDAAPRQRVLTVLQPTLRPLFDTRDPLEMLQRWAAAATTPLAQLRAAWQREVKAVGERTGATPEFKRFWSSTLAGGVASPIFAEQAFLPGDAEDDGVVEPDRGALRKLFGALQPATAGKLEVELIEEIGVRDGRGSFNPWLRELPDPLTRSSWTATARLAPSLASKQGIADGDEVTVTVGKDSVRMAARIVPGQHPQVVGVPVGYGVKDGDGAKTERNGYRLARLGPQGLVTAGLEATIGRAGGKTKLPLMQWHGSAEERPIVHQVDSFDEKAEKLHHPHLAMWGEEHKYSPHWHMTIDLDACTGCSACVVACQAENNLPVVGPENITDHRDMYWLRIDRYFSGDENNPEVLFEPMMCSQCDNAPCETVCPVAATVHSHDGLNMQAYNRCVGTRYCANNCPYKVRRFNWFDFTPKDPVERMVLNPDVVVRERGTMEKCTFCVQRIQLARIEAKNAGDEGVPEVQTACQQSCPARAIHFGDATSDSTIAEQRHEPRAFQVLADLGVRPSITYLARVRRRKPRGAGS